MTGASGVGQSRPGDLSEPLPLRIVGILMLAPFAFATGAYVFAGLLEPMAADWRQRRRGGTVADRFRHCLRDRRANPRNRDREA